MPRKAYKSGMKRIEGNVILIIRNRIITAARGLVKATMYCYNSCTSMKKDIHPTYYADAKVVCACGNTFTTGSTVPELHVEICSNCHPFFTGKQKLVDTAGRVEKFKKRTAIAKATTLKHESKKHKFAKKAATKAAKKVEK